MHVVSFSCLHGELNDARCSYFAKIGSMLRETCNKLCRLITHFKQSYLCKHLRALQTYFTNHVGGLSNVLKRERELNVLYNARYFERILSETGNKRKCMVRCQAVHRFQYMFRCPYILKYYRLIVLKSMPWTPRQGLAALSSCRNDSVYRTLLRVITLYWSEK